MTVKACPDSETLQRLLSGMLFGPEAEQLESHLLHCNECLTTARTLSGVDDLTAAVRTGRSVTDDEQVLKEVIERAKLLQAQTDTAETDQTVPNVTTPPAGDATVSPSKPATNDVDIDFLAPAEQSDEIGRLGGYRILEVLGVGGMGIVFRAEDPQLKRQIALKAIKPEVAASRSSKDRFVREAQATAAIDHDHIVHIYQVAEDRGVPFIAMQFLRGESLRTRALREGRIPQRELLRIGRQVATGLWAAHERGLIHRDIKPDNIWLEEGSGRVKILDFGLVRSATDDAGLTQSGILVGTPRYMAPEQAQGAAIDDRCDLFSLGSVLYHLASGRPPFEGGSLTGTLIAVAQAECRPIEERRPELHPELAALINRLLSKDPDQRPQTAAEVVEALSAIEQNLDGEGAGAPRPRTAGRPPSEHPGLKPRPRSRRTALFVGGLIALGLAVFAWLYFAGVLFKVETEDGTLVLKVTGDDFATAAKGQIVTIKNTQTDETVTIDLNSAEISKTLEPGSYFIVETDSGLRTETSHFTIRSGRQQVVEATWRPKRRAAEAEGGVSEASDVRRSEPAAESETNRAAEFLRGDWKIVGDVIEQTNEEQMAMLLFGSPEFGDGDFTCEVMRSEGKHGLAIVARASDLENYYYFDIGVFDNKWSSIYAKERGANWRRVAQTQIPPIPSDRWVKMRLRLRGDVFEGFIDDELVLRGKDDRRLKGYLGLRTWNESGKYRNLKFTDPSGKILWEGLPELPVDTSEIDTDVHAIVDVDRRAAEYVLSLGGRVKVDGRPLWTDSLPVEPFPLTGVNLEHCKGVTDAGLALLAGCNRLQALNLRWTGTTDAGLFHFRNCKDLQDLELGPGISDEGLANFEGCRELTRLYLTGEGIGDAGVANFEDCRELTILMLQFTNVSDTGIAPFGKLSKLEILDLDWTRVSPAGLSHFKGCQSLKRVILGPGTTDDCLACFQDCRGLTHVDLQGEEITDVGLAHFKDCAELTTLKLHNTAVTGAGLARLKDCAKMASVTLSWNSLSDEEMAVFKNWRKLTHLALDRTQITDAGLTPLKQCKNLRLLKISESPNVSAGMIEELSKALPDCDVRWDGWPNERDAAAKALRDALAWVLTPRGPQHSSYLTLSLDERISWRSARR